jgi:hypothetical protein
VWTKQFVWMRVYDAEVILGRSFEDLFQRGLDRLCQVHEPLVLISSFGKRKSSRLAWVSPESRVQLFRRVRDIDEMVEITDVLTSFFDDPRVVGAARPLVARDHRARSEPFERVECCDPLQPPGVVGLDEKRVDVIVRHVSRDNEAERRNLQNGGIERIGVTNFNRSDAGEAFADDAKAEPMVCALTNPSGVTPALELNGRVDQAHMAEGLWKVAQLLARRGLQLFSE